MRKTWLLFAVAAMFAGSALAAENQSSGITPNLSKGTKVIEGAGQFDVMADELQIQLAFGKLVADGVEVAVVAGLRDSDRYMSTELGVRGEYNFILGSPFVPFLSAGVVWADVEADGSDLDTDAAVFSVGGGVKYFIRDGVAVGVNASYLAATDDIFIDSDDGQLKDDEIRFLFSVRAYFD
jgi:opacity protein-like surface antigen